METFDYADLLRDAYVVDSAAFTIPVQLLHPDAVVPEYQTAGAAGFDLHITEDIIVPANTVKIFYHTNPFDEDAHLDLTNYDFSLANDNHAVAGTGLAFEIPVGYELEIRGRSGLGFKYRIIAFNGTIDSDYRGEVKLLITNLGKEPISFKKGDRVAQGVIKKIDQATFVVTDKLSKTDRGAEGFGSTGVTKP
ncbi:dUTP diphosphatase (plasmid) [Paenibacillus peoriae]|uniref:dUTP diphosphatase n=2 Tax=Paenibacillus peoriae TaxID=59893 RepID=A0A7H0YHE9_9BACL|nr:dUTP diphosphatase [Paenibacillus peoriae]